MSVIDRYLETIEDYIGGNIETSDVDWMSLTRFLRHTLTEFYEEVRQVKVTVEEVEG